MFKSASSFTPSCHTIPFNAFTILPESHSIILGDIKGTFQSYKAIDNPPTLTFETNLTDPILLLLLVKSKLAILHPYTISIHELTGTGH